MHLRSDTTSENNSVQSTNVHQNIEETVVAFEAFPAIGTARTLPSSVMPLMETTRSDVAFQIRSDGWNTYNFEGFCRKFWRTADSWIWLDTVIQREPQIA
jgi:hypothetical protein